MHRGAVGELCVWCKTGSANLRYLIGTCSSIKGVVLNVTGNVFSLLCLNALNVSFDYLYTFLV